MELFSFVKSQKWRHLRIPVYYMALFYPSNHVATYHSGNVCMCPYCGKDLPTEEKLQNHIKINHEVDKTKKDFVCDLCGYATHMKMWLKKHYDQYHDDTKKLKCDFCDQSFSYKSTLEFHIDKKHPNTGEKQFFCDVCHKGNVTFVPLCIRHHNK